MIEGQLYAIVRRREWGPGEKSLFARRNDLRSIRASLEAARRRYRTFDVEKFGADAHAMVAREIEYLEDQHVTAIEALNAVEREHGFSPDHRLEVEDSIEQDRVAMRERLEGVAPIKRSLATVELALETALRRAEDPERYPDAKAQVDMLKDQRERITHRLREITG